MTDEHDLLAAIAADPDDDTLRLAYADFLDELGDEVSVARAEYVRIQVRRQHWPTEPTDSARESWLYRTYHVRWRHPIPGFDIAMDQRRGFPCRASAGVAAVLAAAGDPLAWFFDEFELHLTEGETRHGEAFAGPVLRQVRTLRVRGGDGGYAMIDLFMSGPFPRLERLSLYGLGLNDASIRLVWDADTFPRLRELDLSSNDITDFGAGILLEEPGPRVARLNLTGNPISADAVAALRRRFGSAVDLTDPAG